MAYAIDANEVCARVDMFAFARRHIGQQPDKENRGLHMYFSPFRKETQASFAVYPDHAYDFGESKHYSPIALYQAIYGVDFKTALHTLAVEVGMAEPDGSPAPEHKRMPIIERPEPKKKEVKLKPLSIIQPYVDQVEIVKPYLHWRRVTDPVIASGFLGGMPTKVSYVTSKGNRLTFDSRMTVIPDVFSGRLLSYEYRRDDRFVDEQMKKLDSKWIDLIKQDMAKKIGVSPDDIKEEDIRTAFFGKRYKREYSYPHTVWGADQLATLSESGQVQYPKVPYVIITEGRMNALAAVSAGYRAIAAQPFSAIDIARLTQNVSIIYIAVDNDPAGREKAKKLYKMTGGNDRYRTRLMTMPYDLNDMAQKHELNEFLSGKPYFIRPTEG